MQDEKLQHKAEHYNTAYRVALMVLCAFIAVMVGLAAAKIYQVSNSVDNQTTFIIRYLDCLNDIPIQSPNRQADSDKCFAKYAPKEFIR